MVADKPDKKIVFVYEWFMTMLGLFLFTVSALIVSFAGICVRPFLNRIQAQNIGRKGLHHATKFFVYVLCSSGLVKVDFKELDKLRDKRGIIITPNHPCLMDALFVTSRLPNVVCVMKGSVLSNPLFYSVASLGGFIRSDSPTTFVQQCRDTLEDGAQLLLFPEGTRTMCGSVNPFKGGFSLIAQKTGAVIHPVFIEANSGFLGKNWPLWRKPCFPLIYRTTLGEPFQLEKKQDHRAFTKKFEQYFKDKIDKIAS